jgi:hypothetical protein
MTMIRYDRMGTIAGSAISAVALAAAMAAPAQAAASTGWRVAVSRHYGQAANYSAYLSVVSPGRKDAWAFGGTNTDGASPGSPVAEHWNGRKWRAVALPGGLTSMIDGASAPSPGNIWAISQFGQYVLHWNGKKWAVAKRWPGTGKLLTGAIALSTRNVWVFGTSGSGPGLGTWHYNGRRWSKVSGIGGRVDYASALSPRSLWGIGSVEASQDSIVHYNGTNWARAATPAPAGTVFNGVRAVSASDIWASGTVAGDPSRPVLLHWAGSRWRRITVPWPVQPYQILPDGTGIWLTADSGTTANVSWVLHRSGSGVWTRTRIGAGRTAIFSLARVPGTSALWGAGRVATKVSSDAAIYARGSAG